MILVEANSAGGCRPGLRCGMPTLAWEWQRRIMAGPGRLAALDWGQELWQWKIAHYESAAAIARAFKRAGYEADDDRVLFDATASLLTDVVDAAGGVELSLRRLRDAMAIAQSAWDDIPVERKGGESPPHGVGLSVPALEDAWYSLEEMIVWARILDDRLKRKALNDKLYPPQGLIPAMAAGPRRDAVVAARSRLLTSGVREARYLAGLNLHMQSSHAGSKGGRIRDDRVVLVFPDRVSRPLSHRWELTHNMNRDGMSFAEALFTGVSRFMDDTLSAFELHVPERLKVKE